MYLPFNFKHIINIVLVLLLTCSVIAFSYKNVYAASIYLNPATGNVNSDRFTLSITVDPENSTPNSVSTYISYDPTKLEVVNINNGEFSSYTTSFNDPIEGVIHIEATGFSSYNSINSLASIDFIVLNSSGNLNIKVLNTPTYSTKILNTQGEDLLTSISESNLTIKESTTLTTESTTSMEIPETGYEFLDYRIVIIISAVLSFSSLIIRTNAKSKY